MFLLLLVYITSSNLLTIIESAKILAVFPTPSISHQVVFRPLTLELAKRGHEVVVITTDPAFPKGQTPERLREINVHDISYSIWSKFVSAATKNPNDLVTQMRTVYEVFISIFEQQIEVEEVKELLSNKNNTFDLLLLESCARPALSLAYVYNVPVILISSLGGEIGRYEIFGAPNYPTLYPISLRQKIYNCSTWEKIVELFHNHYRMTQICENYDEKADKVLRLRFGPDFPGLNKLKDNVHLMFLNIHPVWDNNRPVPANIIYVGGLHHKPLKDLPWNLTSILNDSHNGVIYISFGTNVNPSLLPTEKIQIILNVFSKLPYNVLWKWDSNVTRNLPPNVKTMKWFPQADLLRHPKIKLFITQGGLQSTDEAITAGVPLIGMPLLGDQQYNVEQYVHHGLGLRIDLETITEDKFMNAIKTVIENDSYRQNVIRLRTSMQDQRQTPLERAIWWVEYILRHGDAKHLRPTSANLSWLQIYEVEIVVIMLGSLCVAIVVCFIKLFFKMFDYITDNQKVKLK